MSPRAASRLEQLGFAHVYDYVPGKADWMAAGLPRDGENARVPYAGDFARGDVPTCGLHRPLGEALKQMTDEGQDFCVVVAAADLVLGMLYAEEARKRPLSDTVEQAMRGGPTTIRANETVQPLLKRMRAAGVGGILVTDPEGRLVGFFERAQAE